MLMSSWNNFRNRYSPGGDPKYHPVFLTSSDVITSQGGSLDSDPWAPAIPGSPSRSETIRRDDVEREGEVDTLSKMACSKTLIAVDHVRPRPTAF
jgi:hypothetical protein